MGKREREVESEEELIAEGKTRRDLSYDTQSRIKEDIDVNNCDLYLVSLRLKIRIYRKYTTKNLLKLVIIFDHKRIETFIGYQKGINITA